MKKTGREGVQGDGGGVGVGRWQGDNTGKKSIVKYCIEENIRGVIVSAEFDFTLLTS
jgi:hypothetical protein